MVRFAGDHDQIFIGLHTTTCMSTGTVRVRGRGLLSYVHPAFMAPAVGMSLFGGLLAPAFAVVPGALHALAVGLALYTAHLKDGYVDGHLRGEETPALSVRWNRWSMWAATAAFVVVLGALWWSVGLTAALVVVPLWILAILHAPHLDTNPVAGTVGYPLGIGVTIAGGFFVQTHHLPSRILGVALVFVVILSGVKISTDRLDYEFDRSIRKRTVPVALGIERANRVTVGLFLFASVLVVGFVAADTFPVVTAVAAVFPLCSAYACVAGSTEGSIRAQMLLMYPFAVVLFLTLG